MALLQNALEIVVLRLVSPYMCDDLYCVEALLGVFRKQVLGKIFTEYRIILEYIYLQQTSQDIE